ncbi:MAG: SLC13 family permease [Pseudomonadota bacterium]
MWPSLPDTHALSVLALTVLALFLFTRERIPLETSSLLILVGLAVGFELFPYDGPEGSIHATDFFYGFGHEALVAVCALMIAGQGLVRTGALEPVGRVLARAWSVSPWFSLLATLVVGAILSAFVNNTPIVVLLLPILISVSLRAKTAASGILMPMGLATLIGGMGTTIGTSTNLLVVAVAADMGLPRFGMFDFLLPAAIAGGAGILYLWLIAPRLLPERQARLADTSPRIFTAQLHVPADSFAAGKTLVQLSEKLGGPLNVKRIQRGAGVYITPLPDVVVQAGDQLWVAGTPDRLKELEQVSGAKLYSGEQAIDEEHPLAEADQQLAELVITPGSLLEQYTLEQARFAERYQLVPLAIHRAGRTLAGDEDTRNTELLAGDVLLVQGPREQIAEIKRRGNLLVLDATTDLPFTRKAPLALAILAAIVLAAALGALPIAISATAGALLMVLSGCLDWRDVGRALSTQVILIVVASLALGLALMKTGGAEYLAHFFVAAAADLPSWSQVGGLILLMAVLTNIVSNNAAAVIGTPIAISIAQQLGAPPEPFVLAVLFGANMSYATPMAYKTNLLVMNAGGYTFMDFVRVGVPLTLIMWLAFSWLLPMLYGL